MPTYQENLGGRLEIASRNAGRSMARRMNEEIAAHEAKTDLGRQYYLSRAEFWRLEHRAWFARYIELRKDVPEGSTSFDAMGLSFGNNLVDGYQALFITRPNPTEVSEH